MADDLKSRIDRFVADRRGIPYDYLTYVENDIKAEFPNATLKSTLHSVDVTQGDQTERINLDNIYSNYYVIAK